MAMDLTDVFTAAQATVADSIGQNMSPAAKGRMGAIFDGPVPVNQPEAGSTGPGFKPGGFNNG